MSKILLLLAYTNSAALVQAQQAMDLWLANKDAVFQMLVQMSDEPDEISNLHDLAIAATEFPAEEAIELLAIAWIETRFTDRRSKAGACCFTGMLGGRYENPPCELLEASAAVCLHYTSNELAYWRRHCGEAYLDAYNGGWRKCWTSPTRKRCSTECTTYSERVQTLERLISRRLVQQGVEQWVTYDEATDKQMAAALTRVVMEREFRPPLAL